MAQWLVDGTPALEDVGWNLARDGLFSFKLEITVFIFIFCLRSLIFKTKPAILRYR